ncbi:hypothetical protein CHARACLAT_012729 [Characodon lateralis]|uniref:Secreted protein n=1 Tax=Characodon lateralis TaxID=208331 RepID=A0ABU7E457_9TELE|nr:hypothetical protein [Characodon lateralis]
MFFLDGVCLFCLSMRGFSPGCLSRVSLCCPDIDCRGCTPSLACRLLEIGTSSPAILCGRSDYRKWMDGHFMLK